MSGVTLLLDQGLPRSAVDRLRERGIEAEHVGALGMSAAPDREILEYAERSGAVVVSLDSDFHALLADGIAEKPSVIRLRVEGLRAEDLAILIGRVVTTVGDRLESGVVVSANEQRVRVRSLPIGSPKPR